MFAKCLKAFDLAGPLGPRTISVKRGQKLAISELSEQRLEFEIVGSTEALALRMAGCITTEYKDHIQLYDCHLTDKYLAADAACNEVAAAWGIHFNRYRITFCPTDPDVYDSKYVNPHWTIKDRSTKQEVSVPADLLLEAFKDSMLWAAQGNLDAGSSL